MSRTKQYANRVNILKYVKAGDSWRFAAVVEIKGKVVRDHVWIEGQDEHHLEGTYYLEWREHGKRHRKAIADFANLAEAARLKAIEVDALKAGVISRPQPPVTAKTSGIALATAGQDIFLRRIVVFDEANQRELVLLTNHLEFAASTIADIYRERWQIELFFKALKQSCKIKTFVGTSANAVKTQVWTALIAMLLLRYLQLKARFGWHLSNLLALLRQQLFVHRDLWSWLDEPFQPPPGPPQEQMPLALA
jgi:IS4 transposase